MNDLESTNERWTDPSAVAVHHANHGRILSLRHTAAALDEQIKTTVRSLSEARKQLLDITSPVADPDAREVGVQELLSYAKFISKTTVPPTFRRPVPKDLVTSQVEESKTTDSALGTQIANGIATPAAGVSDADPEAARKTAEGIAVSTLSDEMKALLDPVSQLPFEPWPSTNIISMGALARIQGMLEEGKDPSKVLSEEEQESLDKRKAEAEQRAQLEEEERLKRRRESMMALGGSGHNAATEDVFDPDEA